MSAFGFTPDDGSEENPNEMTPEQLAAMLAQMQEQVTEQFQKLGTVSYTHLTLPTKRIV